MEVILVAYNPCYTKERCLIVLARGRSTHREISLYSFENGDKPCVIFNVVREQLCTNKGLEIMERMVHTDPDFFQENQPRSLKRLTF